MNIDWLLHIDLFFLFQFELIALNKSDHVEKLLLLLYFLSVRLQFHQAQFHPLKFLIGLLNEMTIYEHTKVEKIENTKNGLYLLYTSKGIINFSYSKTAF